MMGGFVSEQAQKMEVAIHPLGGLRLLRLSIRSALGSGMASSILSNKDWRAEAGKTCWRMYSLS